MVDEPLGEAMVATAATLPHGENELADLPLSTLPSEKVAVPRIAEAPVALECTEHSTIEIGSNRLVIGLVHFVHLRDGLADENGIHFNPNSDVCSRLFFCIAVPAFLPTAHINMLQALAKFARDPKRVEKILSSKTPAVASRYLASYKG